MQAASRPTVSSGQEFKFLSGDRPKFRPIDLRQVQITVHLVLLNQSEVVSYLTRRWAGSNLGNTLSLKKALSFKVEEMSQLSI